MIKEFPKDYEWIGFFEAEPSIEYPYSDPPWLYSPLHFSAVRGTVEVRCVIRGSLGQIELKLLQNGSELLDLMVTEADAMRIRTEKGRETLEVDFAPKLHLETLYLQLKPSVRVAWANLRPR